MCGIVGTVLKYKRGFDRKTEDSFLQMLFVDTLRGEDSTGIIGVERDGRFHTAKEALEAAWFIPQFKSDQICKDMFRDGKAYIGHNRKKTVGAVSDETAHPFVVNDNFAMVHNGTLYNHKALADTAVDSEALAIVLAQAFQSGEQWKEKLEETLGKVFGAYAVACYNQLTNSVHLLRNKERPLIVAETDDAFYFGSEAGMLNWILTRNGYLYKDIKFQAVEEDVLWTFDLDKQNSVTQTKLTPKKAVSSTSTMSHGSRTFHTAAGTGKGEVTKGEFKRFRKQVLGRKTAFWIEDYVEKNLQGTVATGETELYIFGRHDEWKLPHSITCEIDIRPFNFNRDVNKLLETRWIGTVESAELNEETGTVIVTMTQVKPVLQMADLAPHKPSDADIKAFEAEIEAMGDAPLQKMRKEKFNDLKLWQIVIIDEELAARKTMDNYIERKHNENSTTLH